MARATGTRRCPADHVRVPPAAPCCAFAGDQAASGTGECSGHPWIRRPNGGPVQGVRGRAIWA